MTPVLTSLIAVAGTLLGATLGYVFQRRHANRAEQRAAVLGFANAITEVILNQQDRWHRADEDPGGPEDLAARRESHRLRNIARQAMNGVALHVPTAAVLNQAETTFRAASDVHSAPTATERTVRSTAAHQSVRAFITLASQYVR
ncbi:MULTISPECIES: hypothetical protein [Streptomyces]|uniref:hypothetical protein n=1 Tax=Streptomyces TaxID=1883 RepID=UPI00225ABBF1|nr:hypothetical protein [Streptomyces sp. NBC_00124]MCX5357281.1 cytochrome P450 [Streptomyces sp. NBC_00124]